MIIELKYYDYYSTIESTNPDREITADYELLTSTNRNSGWAAAGVSGKTNAASSDFAIDRPRPQFFFVRLPHYNEHTEVI
jgi:hypothetical protein